MEEQRLREKLKRKAEDRKSKASSGSCSSSSTANPTMGSTSNQNLESNPPNRGSYNGDRYQSRESNQSNDRNKTEEHMNGNQNCDNKNGNQAGNQNGNQNGKNQNERSNSKRVDKKARRVRRVRNRRRRQRRQERNAHAMNMANSSSMMDNRTFYSQENYNGTGRYPPGGGGGNYRGPPGGPGPYHQGEGGRRGPDGPWRDQNGLPYDRPGPRGGNDYRRPDNDRGGYGRGVGRPNDLDRDGPGRGGPPRGGENYGRRGGGRGMDNYPPRGRGGDNFSPPRGRGGDKMRGRSVSSRGRSVSPRGPPRGGGRGRRRSRSFSRSCSRSSDGSGSYSSYYSSSSSRSSYKRNRSRSLSSNASSGRSSSRSRSRGSAEGRTRSRSRSKSSGSDPRPRSNGNTGKERKRSSRSPSRSRSLDRDKSQDREDKQKSKKRKVLDDSNSPKQKTEEEKKQDAITKDQRTVFVSQLVMRAEESEIRKYFRKKCGCKVNEVILLRDRRTGRHKGCAYVELGRLDDVPRALKVSGIAPNFQRFPILVKMSEAEKNYTEKQPTAAEIIGMQTGTVPIINQGLPEKRIEAQKVYVGSIDRNITQAQLYAIFSQFGQLDKVLLQMDMHSISKGFAFLSFADPKAANLAIQVMAGQSLAGRPLRTGWASVNPNAHGVEEVTSQEFPPDAAQRVNRVDEALTSLNGTGLNPNTGLALVSGMGTVNAMGAHGLPSAQEGSSAPLSSHITSVAEQAINAALGLSTAATTAPLQNLPPVISKLSEPTKNILVRNMFDKDTETEEGWEEEIKLDFEDEAKKHGKLVVVKVLSEEVGGKIFASFDNVEAAQACATDLSGRWFDKRQLQVEYLEDGVMP